MASILCLPRISHGTLNSSSALAESGETLPVLWPAYFAGSQNAKSNDNRVLRANLQSTKSFIRSVTMETAKTCRFTFYLHDVQNILATAVRAPDRVASEPHDYSKCAPAFSFSLFKNKVENATLQFRSHDETNWPSFLYPPGSEHNNELDKGFSRGPIVIRVRYVLSRAVIHRMMHAELFTYRHCG